MTTSSSEVTEKATFFRNAAKYSLFAPLIVFGLGIVLDQGVKPSVDPSTYRMFAIGIGITNLILLLFGFMSGIVALCGIKKYGKEKILWRGIAGLLICGFFLSAALLIIPVILHSATK